MFFDTTGRHLQWPIWAGATVCLLGLALGALVQKPAGHIVWKARVLFAFGFFFLVSGIHSHYSNPFNKPGHYIHLPHATKLEVVVEEWPAAYSAGSFKAKGRVRAVQVDGQWKAATGRVFLYFLGHGLPMGGQMLGCPLVVDAAQLALMKPASNPGQFDYAHLMRLEGIVHQVFLRPQGYVVDSVHREQNWRLGLQAWRHHLLENLLFLDGNTRGVAEALLLGYKENLDDYTRNAFSRTGTMHVLAVSGLHVGIVYMVLAWLLQFILGAHKYRLPKLAITLGVLWGYAFITGLPPSAQRAAFMFSLLAIGEQLDRPYNVYNALVLSAFVLLFIQPMLLYQLGFQLSYLAVLGIVAFQPTIQAWLSPPYAILRYAWGLVAVSIAAQITTFPLSIYHFHQFPIIFPLANLIAIPGAFAVLVFGMLLMAVSALGGQVLWLAQWMYQAILDFLTKGIDLLEGLPWASLQGLGMFHYELGLWYAIIICLTAAWLGRSKRVWYIGLALLVLGETGLTVKQVITYQPAEMVVFDVPRGSLYGIRSGSEAILLLDSHYQRDIAFQTQGWLARLHGRGKAYLGGQALELPGVAIRHSLIGMGHSVVCLVGHTWKKLPEAHWYIISSHGLAAPFHGLPSEALVFDASVDPKRILMAHPGLVHAHFVQRDGAWKAGFE